MEWRYKWKVCCCEYFNRDGDVTMARHVLVELDAETPL